MKTFDIIVAVDQNLGIGKGGGLPWHLSGDMKHFKDMTCQTKSSQKKNAVIMGRKTWESLPDKFRPLPDRINVVLTRKKDFPLPKGVLRVDSLDSALALLDGKDLKNRVESVFVIGGQEVYAEAMPHQSCQRLHVTQIMAIFECDAFFPEFESRFILEKKSANFQENSFSYCFETYLSVKAK